MRLYSRGGGAWCRCVAVVSDAILGCVGGMVEVLGGGIACGMY